MLNNTSSKNADAAQTSGWYTFEVIFGIPFFIALVLNFVYPLSLGVNFSSYLLNITGISLMLSGLYIIALARKQFSKHNQPTDPGQPTSQLITTGVFSISRNPLYLGGNFFIAGFAMLCTLFWVLVFMPASLVACHYLLIVPEERYLAEKFGTLYLDYTATVNRWIGRVPFR